MILTVNISKRAKITNGDMIKAITGEKFSRGASVYNHDLMISEGEHYLAFNVEWWNAPYKADIKPQESKG